MAESALLTSPLCTMTSFFNLYDYDYLITGHRLATGGLLWSVDALDLINLAQDLTKSNFDRFTVRPVFEFQKNLNGWRNIGAPYYENLEYSLRQGPTGPSSLAPAT